MSNSPPVPVRLKATEVRKEVMAEVIAGRVGYVSGSGAFVVDGRAITGPRRRTYATMRRYGLVTGGGEAVAKPLALTRAGVVLATEWGLISPQNIG